MEMFEYKYVDSMRREISSRLIEYQRVYWLAESRWKTICEFLPIFLFIEVFLSVSASKRFQSPFIFILLDYYLFAAEFK